MDLPADQAGVLIHEVVDDSPAAEAGLRGGDQQITIDGQQVLIVAILSWQSTIKIFLISMIWALKSVNTDQTIKLH